MVEPEHELVRVSRQLIDELLNDESDPVVVVSLERHQDGTCDLILRRPELAVERDRYREALEAARDALADPNAMAEDTDSPANMAFAIVSHALSAPSPRTPQRPSS